MKMDDARAFIRAAMEYRSGPDSCNSVYMGGMATASVYHLLGLSYGDVGFEKALMNATRPTLNRVLENCQWVIDYMKDNPTKRCPACGTIVKVTRSKP